VARIRPIGSNLYRIVYGDRREKIMGVYNTLPVKLSELFTISIAWRIVSSASESLLFVHLIIVEKITTANRGKKKAGQG